MRTVRSTLDSGTMGGDAGWGFRLVMLLVTLAGLTKLPEEAFWRDAVSRPYVMQAMESLRPWLPPELAKYVKT